MGPTTSPLRAPLTLSNIMLFCPTCANLLLANQMSTGMFFSCKTCPYIFKVQQEVAKQIPLPTQ
jgi:hypothetical protein